MSGSNKDNPSPYTPEEMADIESVSGPVYAWGKSVYEITKPHFETTFAETEGRFVMMDLCSAVPLLKAIVDERVRLDHWAKSKAIVGKIIQAVSLGSKHESNILSTLPEDFHLEVKQLFNTKNTNLRDTLRSGIYSALISQAETSEDFYKNLDHILYRSTSLFSRDFEPKEMQKKGGWEVVKPIENSQTTFVSDLGKYFDVEMVKKIMLLATQHCGTPRPVDVFTVDYSHQDDLRREAETSFPKYFQETYSFKRMMELNNHIQANVFDLDQPPESVNLYTSYEGWPYYMPEVDIEQHRRLAATIGSYSLKPGGRALFFPWMTKDGMAELELLTEVQEVWKSQGLEIIEQLIDPEELMQGMHMREKQLTKHSPIFQEGRERVPLMVVREPII